MSKWKRSLQHSVLALFALGIGLIVGRVFFSESERQNSGMRELGSTELLEDSVGEELAAEANVFEEEKHPSILSAEAITAKTTTSAEVRQWFSQAGRPNLKALGVPLENWIQADPSRAFELYLEMDEGNPILKEYLFYRLAVVWGSTDARAALESASSIKSWSERSFFKENILRTQAIEAPEAALENLAEVSGMATPEFVDLSKQIYQTWAVEEPRRAFANAALHADVAIRTELLGSIARQFGEKNALEAFDWGWGIENPYERRRTLLMVTLGISAHDPEQAWKLTESLDELGLKDKSRAYILDELAATRPHEVRHYIEAIPAGSIRSQAIGRMAGQWVQEAPLDCLKWIAALKNSNDRAEAYNHALSAWSETEPEQAAIYFDGLVDETAAPLRDLVALNWSKQKGGDAAQWLLTHAENGQDISAPIGTVIQNWMHEEAASAVDFYKEKFHLVREEDMRTVTGSWAGMQPQEAAEWVESLDEGAHKQSAMSGVAATWVETDPEGAAEWLFNLEAGESRDTAVESALSVIYDREPEIAFEWAQTLSEPDTRFTYLYAAVKTWSDFEPEKALKAIQVSDLPDNERERLIWEMTKN